MVNIFSLNKDELIEMIKNADFPKYKGDQLTEWLFDKNIKEPKEMSNLGKAFKGYLKENFILGKLEIIEQIASQNKDTIKILIELEDKNTIEMVIMRYMDKEVSKNRNTLCISSQVGCPIGCPFCATGKSGYIRNLLTEEIVEQIFLANRYLSKYGEKINNIVFMGMGEPFLNMENVLKAAEIFNKSYNISSRKITISTSGIVEGIKYLADNNLKYVLAISLHGAKDSLRNYLVPINKSENLKKLIEASKYYQKKTEKRLTYEYIMIDKINITKDDARNLAKLLQRIDCYINGIPINTIKNTDFIRPSKNKIYTFKKWCEDLGLSFSIREEKGLDIDGACGQLRSKKRGNNESNCSM